MATTSNGLYLTQELFFNAFKNAGFNSITFGDPSDIKLNKQIMTPMVHMSLNSILNRENMKTIDYQIIILDLIDKNDLKANDMLNDYKLTDNHEDVAHDLDQRFMKAYRELQSFITELPESVQMTFLYTQTVDKMAGYEINLSMNIPSIC